MYIYIILAFSQITITLTITSTIKINNIMNTDKKINFVLIKLICPNTLKMQFTRITIIDQISNHLCNNFSELL